MRINLTAKLRTQGDSIRDERTTYRIRVKGLLDQDWTYFFTGFRITYEKDEISMLVGSVRDQAALFGILLKIRDLGIPLLSVEYLNDKS